MQLSKTPIDQREIKIYTPYKHGDLISIDEITDRIRRQMALDSLEHFSIASDMDGTMFCEDLGIGIFFLKTLNPDYWKNVSEEDFQKMLMSPDFKKVLQAGRNKEASSNACGLPTDDIYIYDVEQTCKTLEDNLIPQLFALFHAIKTSIENGQPVDEEQITKFSYILSIIDHLSVKLEPVVEEVLQGRIIPRTRFFATKQSNDISQLTQKLLDIGQHQPDSTWEYPEIDHNEMLNLPGYTIKPGLLHEKISKRATRVTAIKRLYQTLVGKHGGILNIITTNHPEVASTVASYPNSPYYNTYQTQLQKFPGTNVNDFTYGTRLATNSNGVYLPILEGVGILKQQKLDRVRVLDRTYKTLIAGGDTSTDTLMEIQAVLNGAYGIMVGRNMQETQAKLHKNFKGTLNPEQLERILFVEQTA